MTKTTTAIHWLTATLPIPERVDIEVYAMKVARDVLGQFIEGPVAPYPRNYKNALGTSWGRLSWHPDQRRMKLCYNMTGADCERLYAAGASVSTVVKQLADAGANFTRIDAAIDYRRPASIELVAAAYRTDPSWTIARRLRPIDQMDNVGGTVQQQMTGVYIGSLKSDRFICVYNKAVEREELNTDWTRIEIRNRGEWANVMGQGIAFSGLDRVVRAAVRDYADCPIEWWQDALAGETAELAEISRKDGDTIRWLIEQVAPVLDRELAACESQADMLYAVYNQILNKHRLTLAAPDDL